MDTFYFGNTGQRLFGVYHPPSAATWRNTGVVLCYPFSNEYMGTHRIFVRLAELLNNVGFPVLRFDYFGFGDSEGDTHQPDLDVWRANITQAMAEVKTRASVNKVSVVGLRLGASLAATLPKGRQRPASLVLWDPIVNGEAYLQRLDARYSARMALPATVPAHTKAMAGYLVNSDFIEQIKPLDLTRHDRYPARQLLLISSQDKNEFTQLRTHLETLSVRLTHHCTNEAFGWEGQDGHMIWPTQVLKSIVTFIAKEHP